MERDYLFEGNLEAALEGEREYRERLVVDLDSMATKEEQDILLLKEAVKDLKEQVKDLQQEVTLLKGLGGDVNMLRVSVSELWCKLGNLFEKVDSFNKNG
jgi:bacterioferritin (cytochrome b1)